jgi:hypothetical protein
MKLIIETTEFEEYHKKISQWYYDCMTFILENFRAEPYYDRGAPFEQFSKLKKKYEETNPQPNWKSLL